MTPVTLSCTPLKKATPTAIDAHPGTVYSPANFSTTATTPSTNDSADTTKPPARAMRSGASEKETIPSIAVAVPGSATQAHSRFLAWDTPIVGTVENDVFRLDLRTVLTKDVPIVRQALISAG